MWWVRCVWACWQNIATSTCTYIRPNCRCRTVSVPSRIWRRTGSCAMSNIVTLSIRTSIASNGTQAMSMTVEKSGGRLIHILRGSRYDGYFERVADRISAMLTEEMRRAVLLLKYLTPDDCHVAGIEYYRAVIEGGVRTYEDFLEWRCDHPLLGVVEWMP